jgi:hypothetical protein
MKKIYVMLVFAPFVHVAVMAQSVYYDAIKLANYVDRQNGLFKTDAQSLTEISEVLKNYALQFSEGQSTQDLIASFTTESDINPDYNPILAEYLSGAIGQAGATLSGKTGTIFSSLGQLNVTSFADGLAKFLVERAKEELNVAFFRKFQEFLNGYPEVKTIFPATVDLVSQISAYQYSIFLPALRSCFHQDMNAFSQHLIALRELNSQDCPAGDKSCQSRVSKMHAFLNDDPLGRTFVGALLISDGVMKGQNPVELLNELSNDEIVFGQQDNFSNGIRMANLFSQSLRSAKENELWVGRAQINQLVSNEYAFKIYLGLLYATDRMMSTPIVFRNQSGREFSLDAILVAVSEDVDQLFHFKNTIKHFGYSAAEVSSRVDEMNLIDQGNKALDVLLYAGYTEALTEFIKQGVTLFVFEQNDLARDVAVFSFILDKAMASCYDIKSENYSSLVIHTAAILDTLLEGHFSFKNDYIKYGNFMANIIQAGNSDEVKAAIDAAVLPVGSSSIKRETFFNVSLNAFIGPMAGTEYLGASDTWSTVLGVTAPLGVAFSWGNISNGKRNNPPEKKWNGHGIEKGGQAVSFYIPLIDVGALATFRLDDDHSDVAAEIKLENIVAPGLYVYWGLPKVPISIGVGGQIGPQLRAVSSEVIDVSKNFYFRLGINAVVDIPFFNFYTRN